MGCSCCLQGPLHRGQETPPPQGVTFQLVLEDSMKGILVILRKAINPHPPLTPGRDLVLQHPKLLKDPGTSLVLVAKTPLEPGFQNPSPVANWLELQGGGVRQPLLASKHSAGGKHSAGVFMCQNEMEIYQKLPVEKNKSSPPRLSRCSETF